jgi:type II secretory pathway pseudopilin PulG
MKARGADKAFSLLETLAVVVVSAMAVGFVAIRMQEMSDEGCLWAAADRVAGTVRLAQFQAATGRSPILLRIGGTKCTLAKAAPEDGSWSWVEVLRTELPPKAHVREVATDSGDLPHRIADGEWSTMIPAAGWLGECRLTLELENGRRAVARLDAASGRLELGAVVGPEVPP